MKTSPKGSYLVIENERFGLVFAKTVSIISGTDVFNNNTFIVHDKVIPYGTENKLFLFFIFFRR